MNILEYRDKHTVEESQALAEKVGTSWQYFKHWSSGYRTPSLESCYKLVKASRGVIDIDSLAKFNPKTKASQAMLARVNLKRSSRTRKKAA